MSPNIILIFICLFLGSLLRFLGKLPKNGHQTLNAFVIWISLPAVVLTQVPALLQNTAINATMLIPVSMSWILFGLSFFIFRALGKKYQWSDDKTGALIMTAGLGNTSFVGFPILESIFGKESISIGVLVDQPGTFLTLSTLGLITASIYSPAASKDIRILPLLKNVLRFPPFIALIGGVLWFYSGNYGPSPFLTVLERLALTLVPLALVAVGFQLKVPKEVLKRQWKPLSLGLGFKLIFSPLVFIGIYMLLLGSNDFATRVTVIESAMAPMITAAVVSEEFGLNAEIASLMVGIGIPVSLFTVYLWNFALAHI